MSDPDPSKKLSAASDDKDSKKVWITLSTEYADILDILAGDSPDKQRSNRKSILIEKMIDEYKQAHEKELRESGKWNKIINIEQKATEKVGANILSMERKIAIVDAFVQKHLELEDDWIIVKGKGDLEEISKYYDLVETKHQELMKKREQLFAKIWDCQ